MSIIRDIITFCMGQRNKRTSPSKYSSMLGVRLCVVSQCCDLLVYEFPYPYNKGDVHRSMSFTADCRIHSPYICWKALQVINVRQVLVSLRGTTDITKIKTYLIDIPLSSYLMIRTISTSTCILRHWKYVQCPAWCYWKHIFLSGVSTHLTKSNFPLGLGTWIGTRLLIIQENVTWVRCLLSP